MKHRCTLHALRKGKEGPTWDLSPPDPNKGSSPAHGGLLQPGEVSVKVWFFMLQTAVGFSSGIRIIIKEMVPTELPHSCSYNES